MLKSLIPGLFLHAAIVASCVPTDRAAASQSTEVSRYDLIWNTPSLDAHGSMPLGNGEVSVNAWVEPSGDLVFYVAKADSWGEHGRLLKIGKLRVTLDPPLPVEPFVQRLDLENGTMVVQGGQDREAVELRLWVDASAPVVRVEIESAAPRTATAVIERWRTERQAIPRADVSDTFEDRSKPNSLRREVFVDADQLMDGPDDRIGWYHFAQDQSEFADLVHIQGLDEFYAGKPDPLLHRVFGAVVTAPRAARIDAERLFSASSRTHRFDLHVLTEHPSSPRSWLASMERQVRQTESQRLEDARAAHVWWWRQFWQRSWIDVTSTENEPRAIVPVNNHPVRIGVDQAGQNRFIGEFGRVTIVPYGVPPDLLKQWSRQPTEQEIQAAGGVIHVGRGELGHTVPESEHWDFTQGLSIDAWIKPGELPPAGGRIVDKTTPGGSDGWLLDTYPGDSLRFIVGQTIVHADQVLPKGEWSHVAASADARTGQIAIYLNGNRIAGESLDTSDDAFVVSRAYALQRFITACAGRGRYPIKFNGSIFTVPDDSTWGDADYRRWGPGYWWQNTRLPYLSMCASGDFEMMEPLFRMYVDDLSPVHALRSRQYTGHDGLLIPECMYFWGGTFAATYGWTPWNERGEDRLQESPWHKREWVAGLELAWMMLDCYDHTGDQTFLHARLVPFATEVLRFFDEQFETGPDGTLVMEPTQALETWWDTTNPMPEVAGMRAVTARLLAIPEGEVDPAMRAYWIELQSKLPDMPTRTVEGIDMLAPAARFEHKSNVENPELYAVFPFRLVSFEKPNAALGVAALEHRWDRGDFGWRQDDLFMTHLGLAEQARTNLVSRARHKHAGSRFPAFWGPNYDWIPDQDHGGVLMRTLQTMLMQTDGRAIYLLPAWPDGWNASFKLHAPFQTTVTGRVEDGHLTIVEVDPPQRRADIVVRER